MQIAVYSDLLDTKEVCNHPTNHHVTWTVCTLHILLICMPKIVLCRTKHGVNLFGSETESGIEFWNWWGFERISKFSCVKVQNSKVENYYTKT